MIRCKVHLYEAAFLPRGGGPLKRVPFQSKKAGLIRITSRNPLGVGEAISRALGLSAIAIDLGGGANNHRQVIRLANVCRL